jgi:3-deoxy-D-manno-octulosonate 8-phosphate phosphatase (KDO 8-P phosphatase)
LVLGNTIIDDLKKRILLIKLVILDVDGVLTDGRIVLGNYGDELKFFDVQDGFGLVMLRRVGFKTVIISAKKSRINHRRAKDLLVNKIYQNAHDKLKIYQKVLKKFKLKDEEVCYIADDLVDMPVFRRVGLAVAVPNGVPEIRESAHYVAQKAGGRGAVREVVDMILKTQGKWTEATERYYR